MSRSRLPSNGEHGTAFRQLPDSYPDDFRDRGGDRDQGLRSERSFYRRDYAQSRDRTRTFDLDNANRRNSMGGQVEAGHERPTVLSRKSMPDNRSLAMPSPSGVSERNNRQSSPRFNASSCPASPKRDPIRPVATTPVAATAPSTLISKPPTGDLSVEDSPANSRTESPDDIEIKDPRLRRINPKVKPISTPGAIPKTASPQPLIAAVGKSALSMPLSNFQKAGSLNSTIGPASPVTPVTGPGGNMERIPAPSGATVQQNSTDDADVTMTDIRVAPEDHNTTTQDYASSNLMDSFVKLMTGFADQVSSTSILKYKRDISKQKHSRCKHNDERNRKNFKDYPVTIEQGKQARRLAEQELVSFDQQLKDHVKVQNELARTMAGFFVSQIEQHKSAQEIRREKAEVFQQTLHKVEELSANVSNHSAEIEQIKQNATKSAKAYELADRAASTCEEAQQAAQKTFTQFNEVSFRVNELSRNVASLNEDVSEDQAQIKKVMSLVDQLKDDVKSQRKHMANAEGELKNLWDEKAQAAVLEGMRKEVNGELAHFQKMQRDLTTQMNSMRMNLKKNVQSNETLAETLAPTVQMHGKKIEELIISSQRPGGNDLPNERPEPLVLGLRSELEELQRSLQDITQKFDSSASRAEVGTLRDSIASQKIEMDKSSVIGLRKELEAFRENAEAYHENLQELTKEVDMLHTGQEEIKESSSAHYEDITTRVEEAETHIQEISAELKKFRDEAREETQTLSKQVDGVTAHNDDVITRSKKAETGIQEISVELKELSHKTREETQNIAKQLNGIAKRVEATMTIPAARPTPPSAPPTPQMHQSAHVPGRGSSSPVLENGVVMSRLAEVNRELRNLTSYITGQFSYSPNLPARLSSLEQMLLNLQSRYNNLTTEPVVRAMVQQMQLMYPYASTAQNEIRVVLAALSELEKLPPKIDQLITQVDSHTEEIAKIDQKVNEQERERLSSEIKQERLVEHVKEERDKLKQHVHGEHEKLKQHVEEQHDQLDRTIATVKEAAVSGAADMAEKVTKLEQLTYALTTAKRAERLSQLSDKNMTPMAVTQLQVNGAPASCLSPRGRMLNQTPTDTPEESDREAILKKFVASARSRRVVPKTIVSDSDDSDVPLAASRTNSSKSIAAASPNGQAPGTFGKRKRGPNASNYDEEPKTLFEVPSSPSKRKVVRRS